MPGRVLHPSTEVGAPLAPAVLEKLLLQRCPLAVSIKDLTAVADLPWAEQVAAAFDPAVDRA